MSLIPVQFYGLYVPFASLTEAMPFSLRHRPPPNCLRKRARSRKEEPRALLSISRILPMASKFIQSIITRRTDA